MEFSINSFPRSLLISNFEIINASILLSFIHEIINLIYVDTGTLLDKHLILVSIFYYSILFK